MPDANQEKKEKNKNFIKKVPCFVILCHLWAMPKVVDIHQFTDFPGYCKIDDRVSKNKLGEFE